MKWFLFVLLPVAWPSAGLRAASDGEWAADLLAARAKVIETQRGAAMSPWYVTEDFHAKSFDDAKLPEKGVDLGAEAGRKARKMWRRAAEWTDGAPVLLPAADSSVTYLYRTIAAPSDMPLPVRLGSDDGLAVWLNGRPVLSKDVTRGVETERDDLVLALNAGTNALLLKVHNREGVCGFFFSAGSAAERMSELTVKHPRAMFLFQRHFQGIPRWFSDASDAGMERRSIQSLLGRLKESAADQARFDALVKGKAPPTDPAWLVLFLSLAERVESFSAAALSMKSVTLEPLRRAIEHLAGAFPDRYPAAALLAELDRLEGGKAAVESAMAGRDDRAVTDFVRRFEALRRRALLADNPLIDFEKILVVRREETGRLGLPQNWQGNSSLDPRMNNEIATLDLREPDPVPRTIYKPAAPWFVGDVDLNFDGRRMLFSSIGTSNRWHVFEIGTDGKGLRQVSPPGWDDIDFYDPCYLPDGRLLCVSSSGFHGVPCVGGKDYVGNLHLMNADGTGVRRLAFDQDNDWCPTVMPDGRVMYTRWEYTDSAHYFSRVLMNMNPDGTGQTEYYGSNSYWPNSTFFARPIPGDPGKFIAVISGHHGAARMGELVLFDADRGRKEGAGALQRIPGWGRPVEPVIKDGLVNDSWPKFLHPYPLSAEFFLVACKPSSSSPWGIYLADVFDNLLLVKEEPGQVLFEPVPLKPQPVPPTIPDRIKPGATTASAYVHNVYTGRGLEGVPPGTVKSLRVFQYEYAYRHMGGHYAIGIEGPWDVRRIIGTVPVYEDGSAFFEFPANTPVALQPLDAEGKALQQLRSWFVGMPGEVVSCTGCHEAQNASLAGRAPTEAARRAPLVPEPWRGPKRGFSFVRDVQPVLDRYCAGCHDGAAGRPNLVDTTVVPAGSGMGRFPQSYIALHPFVRRNGPEGDYRMLTPLEFHADTSELVQMLRKGHHNVTLDAEAWDRLITWIDLNVPAHGTWTEARGVSETLVGRRRDMKKLFAGVDEDIEAIPPSPTNRPAFVAPPPEKPRPARAAVAGWPFDAAAARAKQAALGDAERAVDLGGGVTMKLRRIPAGEFEMGDVLGAPDEFPTTKVRIGKPFWIGATEVTLRQYQCFDADHLNGYYDMHYKDQVKPGYLMDDPDFPVIRVSWERSMEFCRWLSARAGRRVTLPSEAQWEWACRAGAGTPFYYGGFDADFSALANLADRTIRELAVKGVNPQPIENPDPFWDYVPKDDRFDDGTLHLAAVGRYQPNAWGLHDTIGNVAEWTRSTYRPYPWTDSEGDAADTAGRKVARGGSWADRPKTATASRRLDYPPWQRVYNVGFRVVIEE